MNNTRTNHAILLSAILYLTGCNNSGESATYLGFDKTILPDIENTDISADDLGRPERILSDDSLIIVLDYYDSQFYSTFDIESGKLISRFGTVGEGPDEIQLGTIGSLSDGHLVACNDRVGKYGEYNPLKGDSSYVSKSINYPVELMVSRINRLSDSTLVAMGSYNEAYKYVIMHDRLGVTDSIIPISGKDRDDMNMYHKFLGEQGDMALSPDKKRIAATTNYSDNIDFLSVQDGKLTIIAQDRQRDAKMSPITIAPGANQMVPAMDKPMGFLDVCANNENVFALYSPEEFAKADYNSPYILVYDWKGNRISVIDTKHTVISVAANSSTLFLLTIDNDGEFAIKRINIDSLGI